MNGRRPAGRGSGESARYPLPAVFRRTWVVVLTARSAQFVEAFLPLLLLQSLGASASATAAVLVAQQVTSTAAYSVEGRLVRRYGMVGVTRWGLLGSALAVGVLSIAETALVGGIAAAAYGATSGAWRAAVQAMLPSTLIPAKTPGAAQPDRDDGDDADLRSRAFAAIFWAANLGAIGSAGAGALGVPLRLLFAVQAGTTAVAFMLTWLLPSRLGRPDTVPAVPDSQRPSPADTRSAKRATLVLVLAFVPATMLMFQAFGGLAVAMPADAYRTMVLVNAIVLVVAQPLTVPLLRYAGATTATVLAILAMAIGIAAQTWWPHGIGWTVLWTLGELVVVIVPGALITAAVPAAQVAGYVGRFQVAQGLAATLALYGGPMLAGIGPGPFAIACLASGALGMTAILLARSSVRTAWQQPLTCPCGALFCVCGRTYNACASPSPVLTHQAIT